MSDYDLKGMQGSSMYQLGNTIGTVNLQGDWMQFRSEVREICDHFLTLAAASLLADKKVNFFFLNLCRCAENWRHFLVSSRDHFGRHVPLTYNAPLYAAIIADDKTILQGLVEALPGHWLKGEEYEDDYLVCKLHALLAANHCQLNNEIINHLDTLAEVAEEPINSILFKALLGIDKLQEEDFWSQFEAALYAHEKFIERKMNTVTTNIKQFIAHRYIWFEGLAWLRLAQAKGFTLPSKSIMFCPYEALETMPEAYAGDWILVPDSKQPMKQ
jgi:hypothetical protein